MQLYREARREADFVRHGQAHAALLRGEHTRIGVVARRRESHAGEGLCGIPRSRNACAARETAFEGHTAIP